MQLLTAHWTHSLQPSQSQIDSTSPHHEVPTTKFMLHHTWVTSRGTGSLRTSLVYSWLALCQVMSHPRWRPCFKLPGKNRWNVCLGSLIIIDMYFLFDFLILNSDCNNSLQWGSLNFENGFHLLQLQAKLKSTQFFAKNSLETVGKKIDFSFLSAFLSHLVWIICGHQYWFFLNNTYMYVYICINVLIIC